jgi:hypothetical protein
MESGMNFALPVLLLLASCVIGQAQSGRRQAKPMSPPPPPITTESESPPPQNKPALPKQTLIVGMDELTNSIRIPTYVSEAIWNGFMERLRDLSSVTINSNTKMGRKEAIDHAKKETENFVVLLQTNTDSIDGSTNQSRLEDLVVSYTIFTPTTGKIKTQGRVYVRSSRSVLGRGLPTGINGETQLNAAGREAAERVMQALQIRAPKTMS